MKNKYVMIEGLAFTEHGDMEKLSAHAKQGWILDGIKCGLFYKLKKAEPQEIVYSMDYQYEADEEYFSLFEEAGWKHVLTSDKAIHIFSAEKGTEPIYSDSESEISKYTPIRDKTRKGSIISAICSGLFIALALLSAVYVRELCIPFLAAFLISLCIFVFNIMPFVAYSSRIKQIEQYGKCTDTDTEANTVYFFNLVLGAAFLIYALLSYMKTGTIRIVAIVIGLSNLSLGYKFYSDRKKRKKDN